MANIPQSLLVGVGGFGRGATSSSLGAGGPANKDRKMQSTEKPVLGLINPDLRENALIELPKACSSHFREKGTFPGFGPLAVELIWYYGYTPTGILRSVLS